MMKNGLCPKCGGTDIRMGRHWACRRDHLAVSSWGLPLEVVNYVCISCGYLENYVREPDLATLAKKWSRVGRSGKAKPITADPEGWER
jgi:predicted nucleic-acid-binding Zn-ribbon protein